MPNPQSPVIYQNKVREDNIKSPIKAMICQGLHAPYKLGFGTVEYTRVPEPGTILGLAIVTLGVGLLRRKKDDSLKSTKLYPKEDASYSYLDLDNLYKKTLLLTQIFSKIHVSMNLRVICNNC